MPGGYEWLIIIGVLLLLFGARKLPDMARSIGQSARVFKGEMKGLKDDEPRTDAEEPAEQPSSPELSPGTTLNQPSQQVQQAQPSAGPAQGSTTNGEAAPQAQSRTDAT